MPVLSAEEKEKLLAYICNGGNKYCYIITKGKLEDKPKLKMLNEHTDPTSMQIIFALSVLDEDINKKIGEML